MVMYFNPLKVLMPVALFLLGLGIAKGIFDMVVHPLLFAVNTVLIFVTGLIIASLALLADLIVWSRRDFDAPQSHPRSVHERGVTGSNPVASTGSSEEPA